ncbi:MULTISPECIES: hypothetical protein [Exiguobacterium]|nr:MULTISPECIES: hypothetical protein [Exiguobacterium]
MSKQQSNIERYIKHYLGETASMSIVVQPLRMQIHLEKKDEK